MRQKNRDQRDAAAGAENADFLAAREMRPRPRNGRDAVAGGLGSTAIAAAF